MLGTVVGQKKKISSDKCKRDESDSVVFKRKNQFLRKKNENKRLLRNSGEERMDLANFWHFSTDGQAHESYGKI